MEWLTYPLRWHSSRKPSGYDFSAMTPAQIKMLFSPFLFWYKDDYYYALTTICAITLAILVAAVFHVIFRIRLRKAVTARRADPLDKLVAYGPYAVSRQYLVRFGHLGSLYLPPLSAIIAIVLLGLWCTVLTFAVRPYKWPNMAMGHSQPIATRTGWIATGMTPMIIAFATARNYIAYVTGTSHEKLQVFHRWLAAISFVPAMIHSFMFIYMDVVWGLIHKDLKTNPEYWTGIVALVALTYLVFSSWAVFRNKNYELFKKVHFILAALYMVAFFIHCDFRLSSWDYFAASAAIYGSCYLYRLGRTLYNSGIALFAYVSLLPAGPDSGLVHVRIPVPSRVAWKPGQHAFLRFWGLGVPHAFSSHPWTIASVCTNAVDGERIMEFVLRVREGITLRLARMATGKASAPLMVWVDGPYGGVPGGLDVYDDVLFLGGGSGLAFIAPLVQDQLQRRPVLKQKIHLVMVVRHTDDAAWMDPIMANVNATTIEGRASARVFVTGDAAHSISVAEDGLDEKVPELPKRTLRAGRPDLRQIVHDACAAATGRLAIVACGPDSFLYDVRNEVAQRQLATARGEGPADIFLHTENYGW